MRKIQNLTIIILISIFGIANGNAQTDNAQKTYNDNSYFTINLLSTLNTLNPRWRIGYIKNINEKWKLGLDFGYGNRNLSFSDFGNKIGDNYKLWEIRPEIYYIINSKNKTNQYFSVEIFYINHKDVFSDSHYFTKKGTFSFDKANYNRQKSGFNLKYGLFFHSKNRISFNLYSGLGVRFRKNNYSEFINLEQYSDYFSEDMINLDAYRETEGTSFGMNLSFGFKICYR